MKYKIFTTFFLWVFTGSTVIKAQKPLHLYERETEKSNVEDYPMIQEYPDGSNFYPIEAGNYPRLEFLLASSLFPF